MRVLTLNANGIRAAVRKGLLDLLAPLRPDVICLQEVRARPEQVPPLLADYRSHWHPGYRRGYSGVGVLVHQHGVWGDALVDHGSDWPAAEAEGRVQRLRERHGRRSLFNVYVPSGSSGEGRQVVKMAFLERLAETVTAEAAEGREVLLVGDLNVAPQPIDLTNWRTNQRTSGFLPEERAWFAQLLSAGMRDVIRDLAGPDTPVYTWWSSRSGARARNVGWRLDHQLATPKLAATATTFTVHSEPIVSDHAPLVVEYDAP